VLLTAAAAAAVDWKSMKKKLNQRVNPAYTLWKH